MNRRQERGDGAAERGGVVAHCRAAQGQEGPYVTIPARGTPGSPWSPIGRPFCPRVPPDIFMASPVPCGARQKQIDTYKRPPRRGSHDTFEADNKRTFQTV